MTPATTRYENRLGKRKFSGYLMMLKKSAGPPKPEVSFSYEFISVDNEPTVLIRANIYGVELATDFFIRELRRKDDVPPEFAKLVEIHEF